MLSLVCRECDVVGHRSCMCKRADREGSVAGGVDGGAPVPHRRRGNMLSAALGAFACVAPAAAHKTKGTSTSKLFYAVPRVPGRSLNGSRAGV